MEPYGDLTEFSYRILSSCLAKKGPSDMFKVRGLQSCEAIIHSQVGLAAHTHPPHEASVAQQSTDSMRGDRGGEG